MKSIAIQLSRLCAGLVLALSASAALSQSANWTDCAEEGGTCQFEGSKLVRYGAGNNWFEATHTNSVRCSNAVFGDPINGTRKSCQYANSVSWSAPCAEEGQTCSFNGTKAVRYGAGSSWATGIFIDRVACSNDVFGDPIHGTRKACQTADVRWQACASERGGCSFSGRKVIRYGANQSWVEAEHQDGVRCNNGVFGDPIPGTAKTCEMAVLSNDNGGGGGGGGGVLTPLDTAQVLSRATVDGSSYSASGVPKNGDFLYAGPMGGAIVSYKGYQYALYYQSNGRVTIARRNLSNLSNGWDKSELQGYRVTTNDQHNKMTMAISKADGVIHIAFDHHTTREMRYASSLIGAANNPGAVSWDNSVFTYNKNFNQDRMFSGTFVEATVTYPEFITVGNSVVLTWRSGGQGQGRTNLAFYNTGNQTWTIRREVLSESGTYREGNYSSDSRGPYIAGFKVDSQNIMHLTWLWREQCCAPNGVRYRNHGLYYAYSRDMGDTWFDTNGRSLGRKITINNIHPVWNIPMTMNPRNSAFSSSILDDTRELEVYLQHQTSSSGSTYRDYIYKRASNGSWTRREGRKPLGGTDVRLPANGPEGAISWDYNRLETNGLVSVLYQPRPSVRGRATPLRIIDYRFAR